MFNLAVVRQAFADRSHKGIKTGTNHARRPAANIGASAHLFQAKYLLFSLDFITK